MVTPGSSGSTTTSAGQADDFRVEDDTEVVTVLRQAQEVVVLRPQLTVSITGSAKPAGCTSSCSCRRILAHETSPTTQKAP